MRLPSQCKYIGRQAKGPAGVNTTGTRIDAITDAILAKHCYQEP